VYLEK